MDPDLALLDQLVVTLQAPEVDPSRVERAVLEFLRLDGARRRRGEVPPRRVELIHRQDLLARALSRLDAAVIEDSLYEVAASLVALRDGDDEAAEMWHEAALAAVERRESFERTIVAVAAILGGADPEPALQRELARLGAQLAAVDRFAQPQAGGLTAANATRRTMSRGVTAGTLPRAAWWLGPRGGCPDAVAAGRELTADEAAHVASCDHCQDDRRRAALLDELFDDGGRAHDRSSPRHVSNCAECTMLEEALRDAAAVAALLDPLDELYDTAFGETAPQERRAAALRRHDGPRASAVRVAGTVDGRTCEALMAVVPARPVDDETTLSLSVMDAGTLRGRPVQLRWKVGGLLAEGTFEWETRASLPLTAAMGERFRGRTLPDVLAGELIVEVGAAPA